jgi:hypothetical protein
MVLLGSFFTAICYIDIAPDRGDVCSANPTQVSQINSNFCFWEGNVESLQEVLIFPFSTIPLKCGISFLARF